MCIRDRFSVPRTVSTGLTYFVRTTGSEAAETVPLFGGPHGYVTGPLSLFGAAFFIALPALVVASLRILDAPRSGWLPVCLYAWYFLALAMVQRRFAGYLAVPFALFTAAGGVALTARFGVVSRSPLRALTRPAALSLEEDASIRRACALAAITVLLIGSTGGFVPVKMDQSTIDGGAYRAADRMADYAAERDLAYPENYVFSTWGHNRMYNYLVSGHAREYSFAKSNYVDFLVSSDGTGWYRRLSERGVGFVVTRDAAPSMFSDRSLHVRLHRHYGIRTEDAPGLGHYRWVYASDDASLKVFALVPGARVTGTGPPNATVWVIRTAAVGPRSVDYVRVVETNSTGAFSVRVAYPGTYEVNGRTVKIPESAVERGTTVRVGQSE